MDEDAAASEADDLTIADTDLLRAHAAALERMVAENPEIPRNILAEQLAEGLAKNLSRVIDVFRAWDDDSSGTIDKIEFRRGLHQLGLTEVPREEVDASNLAKGQQLVREESEQAGGPAGLVNGNHSSTRCAACVRRAGGGPPGLPS